ARRARTAAAKTTSGQEVVLFASMMPYLVKTLDAAQSGDRAATVKTQHQYDIEWHGVETYLSVRSADLYRQLETEDQAALIRLLGDPNSSQADIVAATKTLLAKFDESLAAV